MVYRIINNIFQIGIIGALGLSLWARFVWGWSPSISSVEDICSHSVLICPFYNLTGWHCPGCGMTRALVSFFAGDPLLSFYFHPLGPLLGCFFIYLFFKSVCQVPVRLDAIFYGKSAWVGAIVLIAWGLLRNLTLLR